jgi:hypothetical protein
MEAAGPVARVRPDDIVGMMEQARRRYLQDGCRSVRVNFRPKAAQDFVKVVVEVDDADPVIEDAQGVGLDGGREDRGRDDGDERQSEQQTPATWHQAAHLIRPAGCELPNCRKTCWPPWAGQA